MMVLPKKVVFHNYKDIVDYVSKGLPPTKENFNQLMNQVRNPSTPEQVSNLKGKEVVIADTVIPSENARALTADILERVYENRISNRNKILIIGGILLAVTGAGIYGYCYYKDKKEEPTSFDKWEPVVHTEESEHGTITTTFF